MLRYEDLTNKLEIRLHDPDFGEERMKKKAVTFFVDKHCGGDFALTYVADISENEELMKELNVYRHGYRCYLAFDSTAMHYFGIDHAQLHNDAIAANVRRGATLRSVNSIILHGFNLPNLLHSGHHAAEFDIPLFMLSTLSNHNGASLIIHDQIRESIGEFMQGDYYALPSSVHEWMIIPYSDDFTIDELTDLVKSANEELFVDNPEDLLSDKVQWCSHDGKIWMNAKAHEKEL